MHCTRFLALAISTLLDSESRIAGPRVDVSQPSVTLVATREVLEEFCGARTVACTRFIAYRLEAACFADGDRSRIRAVARVRPLIFVFRNPTRWLDHEMRHIIDVREALESYVADLERTPFESQGQCEATALGESRLFRERLRQHAQMSNDKLR